MPELGCMTATEAAAMTGLAPMGGFNRSSQHLRLYVV
ncbi:hypothetical protein NKW51_14110 [Acetobacter lambici]|uniref:Transposase n=1 Tax=Acetobacter lambici TaxID=1332824 RepID=A0ABT1F4A6_9PROT|nr:hypothetical protein [Acetobacter lambici]MCP1243738.1 hypothetical protein [Acetobacter lambici]MCP1259801.1 hypothetical protein [Acetobacter lambici]